MPAFNPDRAALILLDSILLGDERASEKWKVTVRTIENHRARLKSDPFGLVLRHSSRAGERHPKPTGGRFGFGSCALRLRSSKA